MMFKKAKRQPLWLSVSPLALAACGSDGESASVLDLADSYALALRGNGTTISSGTLGLDDGLSVSLVSDPVNGDAAQNQDGTVSYTPDNGYSGNDEVQVQISDGDGNSQIVTINLDVGGPGGDPIAADDKFSVAEDGQFAIIGKYGVLANDFDETDLTATLLSAPANGSVTLNADGSYTYTPAPDFNGQDSFTYTVTDVDGDTDTGTVNILVNPVNDAPVAADYLASGTTWEQVATGQLQVTDADGDMLTFAVDQVPSNGSVTMYADGSFEYTPDRFFFGTDTFTYTVSDGNGGMDTATVTIDVDPAITTFGFQINGIDQNDRSGKSVSSAGDVNNDGIDDLIIGAFLADPNGFASGESYVVFGGATVGAGGTINLSSLNGPNGFVLNGIDGGDESGSSVSLAGDINNDGIDDLIIGARLADPNGNNSGESYVVFGSATVGAGGVLNLSSLNGGNGFVLNGIDAYDFSGHSVSLAGDINNDGIDDLIIGARYADPNGNASGESYVIFGGAGVGAGGTFNLSSLNGPNGFVLNGIDAYDESGYSVSSAGDINGDGIDDLIIGAPFADPNGTFFAGESYVVFGGATVGAGGTVNLSGLTGPDGFVLNGIDAGDESSSSVSSAGDINNDGIDDLIISAYGGDPNGNASGESYVVFGSATVGAGGTVNLSSLTGTNGFVLNGIDATDLSGYSVSSAGDFNGDGIDDLIIGAYLADPNGTGQAGESYVVFGSATVGAGGTVNLSSLNGTNGFILNGIDGGDESGFSVSSAGDINGDGIDDLIIGARLADPNGGDSGESYVVFGGVDQLTFYDMIDGQQDGHLDLSLLANPPIF